MNDETTTLDQTDEEILSYMASDEALEAAASTKRGVVHLQTIWAYSASARCCLEPE